MKIRRDLGVDVAMLVVVASLICGAAWAQQSSSKPAPLVIVTQSLPEAQPHREYVVRLEATGGVHPLHWEISQGKLPKGVILTEDTGVITGTPEEAGDFDITITVTDSSQPPRTASKDLKVISVAALSLEWKVPPRVDSDQISGSIVVSNGTKEVFDLTVIVVAVNEIGKAFALGYQRFDLQANNKDVEIKFGSALPRGQYVVHADAIAEVVARRAVYRSRLQTPQRLAVTAPSL